MEKLVIVVSQAAAREFQGNDGPVTAVDLNLSDGLNQFLVTAYDKTALRLAKDPLPVGSLINAEMQFSVRNVKTEKGEFANQQVRLSNYGVIVKP